MDNNSKAIKAIEDDGADRAQEFCALFNEIEKLPHPARALNQLDAVMKTLIYAGDIKDAPLPPDDEDLAAAQRLGEAFSLIEEYRDYLPVRLYNDLVDNLNDWISDAQWQSDPQLCRQILPLLIAKVIAAEEIKLRELP